jgi:hypothetical protein
MPIWFRNLRFADQALLIGPVAGSFLLILPYVMLFINGRDPHGDKVWGWSLEAVLSGVMAGIFVGSLVGGVIGLLVGVIGEAVISLMDSNHRDDHAARERTPPMWDRDLDH